jgi:hypothetical protein
MIKDILNKISSTFLAIFAIAFGIFAIFFMGKSKGRKEEGAKQVEKALKTGLEVKADDKVRSNAGAAAARKQLRKSAIDR